MKRIGKVRAVILTMDLLLGLLLLCVAGYRYEQERETACADRETAVTGTITTETIASETIASETVTSEPDESERKIALTFDDGPHPFYTEDLLDGLLERGVPVTFFVTGEHAALHPDVIERMYEEGHFIGNHTYSHIPLNGVSREMYVEELNRTNEVIEEITGEEVICVRPPYGMWDKTLEKELNLIPVLWTIDPLDWCTVDVDVIVDRVVRSTEEGDIILMHDYYQSSVEAALKIVDRLQEEGYTFVTVEELLFD